MHARIPVMSYSLLCGSTDVHSTSSIHNRGITLFGISMALVTDRDRRSSTVADIPNELHTMIWSWIPAERKMMWDAINDYDRMISGPFRAISGWLREDLERLRQDMLHALNPCNVHFGHAPHIAARQAAIIRDEARKLLQISSPNAARAMRRSVAFWDCADRVYSRRSYTRCVRPFERAVTYVHPDDTDEAQPIGADGFPLPSANYDASADRRPLDERPQLSPFVPSDWMDWAHMLAPHAKRSISSSCARYGARRSKKVNHGKKCK